MCKFPPLREKRDPGQGWTKESLSFHLHGVGKQAKSWWGTRGRVWRTGSAVTHRDRLGLRRIKGLIKIRCNWKHPFIKEICISAEAFCPTKSNTLYSDICLFFCVCLSIREPQPHEGGPFNRHQKPSPPILMIARPQGRGGERLEGEKEARKPQRNCTFWLNLLFWINCQMCDGENEFRGVAGNASMTCLGGEKNPSKRIQIHFISRAAQWNCLHYNQGNAVHANGTFIHESSCGQRVQGWGKEDKPQKRRKIRERVAEGEMRRNKENVTMMVGVWYRGLIRLWRGKLGDCVPDFLLPVVSWKDLHEWSWRRGW